MIIKTNKQAKTIQSKDITSSWLQLLVWTFFSFLSSLPFFSFFLFSSPFSSFLPFSFFSLFPFFPLLFLFPFLSLFFFPFSLSLSLFPFPPFLPLFSSFLCPLFFPPCLKNFPQNFPRVGESPTSPTPSYATGKECNFVWEFKIIIGPKA